MNPATVLDGVGPDDRERSDLALELRNVDAAYGTIAVLRGVDLAVPF
ncbi:MAG: hypothetical protein JWM72_4434, partial [Actinomycetia bacterium]|nr:hypothetical protein [Actinomycetes bacterium]